MTDKELLELAAKAAGIESEWREITHSRVAEFKLMKHTKTEGFWSAGKWWNPLTDDGDALRLAVKLKLNIQLEYSPTYHYADNDDYECLEYLNGCCTKGCDCNDDPYAATRRAIVRASAAIGEQM